MPTYQYKCRNCDELTEVVQRFSDAPLEDCPRCQDGKLRKVYNAVGIVFKGSGFYATDSRSASAKNAAKPAESSASKTSATPEKKSTAAPAASSTSSSAAAS